MSEKKGFFGRLFGRGDKEDRRDAPDSNAARPADDKEKAAASATEDAEAGAPVSPPPASQALGAYGEEPRPADAPPQREDEDNLAPDANEEGYLEIEDEHAMPVADTGPAVPDEAARMLNEVPDEAAFPGGEDFGESPEEIRARAVTPDTDSVLPAEAPEETETAPETSVADIPEPDMPGDDTPPALQADTPIAEDTGVAETPVPAPEPEETPKKKGFFARLREGLSKSSDKLSGGVGAIFTKRKLDDQTLEELEDLLISADLGLPATTRIVEKLSEGRYDKDVSPEEVRAVLAEEVAATLAPLEKPLAVDPAKRPHVILMTGVNGAGKTTTIGKLAKKFTDEGKSVMLAAGDTFRAAAIEQLQVWGERTGAPVVTRPVGSDAAGLAFDALKEATDKQVDVLMIDTAGRLQNRRELMDELAKIVRVIRKIDESAPHASILILDATVGQNALSQAEAFSQTANITGLIMTKLDGTARGGVLVALADKFSIPIHYIGVGESVEDLQPFRAEDFSRALAGIATEQQ